MTAHHGSCKCVLIYIYVLRNIVGLICLISTSPRLLYSSQDTHPSPTTLLTTLAQNSTCWDNAFFLFPPFALLLLGGSLLSIRCTGVVVKCQFTLGGDILQGAKDKKRGLHLLAGQMNVYLVSSIKTHLGDCIMYSLINLQVWGARMTGEQHEKNQTSKMAIAPTL